MASDPTPDGEAAQVLAHLLCGGAQPDGVPEEQGPQAAAAGPPGSGELVWGSCGLILY